MILLFHYIFQNILKKLGKYKLYEHVKMLIHFYDLGINLLQLEFQVYLSLLL